MVVQTAIILDVSYQVPGIVQSGGTVVASRFERTPLSLLVVADGNHWLQFTDFYCCRRGISHCKNTGTSFIVRVRQLYSPLPT